MDLGYKIDSVQAIPLDILEEIAEETVDKKELKVLKAKLEEQYQEEMAFVRHYSASLIDKLVSMQVLNPQELSALGNARSTAIQNYLSKTAGLEKRLIFKGGEKVKGSTSEAIPNRLEIIVP
ncbi:MAG: hypothetical protein IE884_08390 [Sulfuricurvum sp.]|nr:hypothetical protein [Sulfuricurvum sp.]